MPFRAATLTENRKSLASIAAALLNVMTSCEAPPL